MLLYLARRESPDFSVNSCCTLTPRAGSIQSVIVWNMLATFCDFGVSSSFAALMPCTCSTPAYFTSNDLARSWPRPPNPSTRKVSKSALFLPALYSVTVSYTHLRAHETDSYLVCRLLLE